MTADFHTGETAPNPVNGIAKSVTTPTPSNTLSDAGGSGEGRVIAKLIEALSWCDGCGTFVRGDDREIVLTFTNNRAGMDAFEALSDLIGGGE